MPPEDCSLLVSVSGNVRCGSAVHRIRRVWILVAAEISSQNLSQRREPRLRGELSWIELDVDPSRDAAYYEECERRNPQPVELRAHFDRTQVPASCCLIRRGDSEGNDAHNSKDQAGARDDEGSPLHLRVG